MILTVTNASEVKEDIFNVTGHKKERNAKSQEGMKVMLQDFFKKNHGKKRRKKFKN